jgi:hypothetical protein
MQQVLGAVSNVKHDVYNKIKGTVTYIAAVLQCTCC